MNARETFLLLFQQGLDEVEARGLIEVAGSLFTSAAYAAAALGQPAQAFRLACEGRARVLATALHLEALELTPKQRQQLEALRAGIREQSRMLERAIGLERHEILERLQRLRAEISAIVSATEEGSHESDPLTQAAALVAEGSVIVVPIVTEVGGKLLLVTAGRDHDYPVITAIDLPEFTSARLKTLIYGDEMGRSNHWLAAFANDVPWRLRMERSARAVEEISRELWSLIGCPLGSRSQRPRDTAGHSPYLFTLRRTWTIAAGPSPGLCHRPAPPGRL